MKKFIYAIPAMLLMVLPGCKAEEGTEPGTDPTPGVVVYTYTPDEAKGLNPDNDITVRFATNSAARDVYYLVENQNSVQDFIKNNGEAAYVQKVVSEGTKFSVDGVAQTDIDLIDLHGPMLISAVASNGTTGDRSSIFFQGLDWTPVKTGTFYPQQSFLNTPIQCDLEICTTDTTLYRLRDVFTEGYSMKIQLLPELTGKDADGEYTFARIPETQTPYTLRLKNQPDPVALWLQDIGYWQGNASFITSSGYESGMYKDKSCFFQIAWMAGSVGCLGYQTPSFFIPN